MVYFAQNMAFSHKKNTPTVFDEYYKKWKKHLDYISRALLATTNIVGVLALTEALGEDEMKHNDAEKNSVKKYNRASGK